MKIAILTMGTRGDVQPYAILGQALQQRGHHVILSTTRNFEDLVKSYQIDFAPIEGDIQQILNTEEGKKMMKGNPFAIRRNLRTWVYPQIVSSLSIFYELALASDLVLYHVKTLADSFADQFPNKMIRANLLPIIEPTNEFANPAFSGIPLPAFLNRFSFTFSSLSIRLLSNPINRFRKQFDLPVKFKAPAIPNIYALSPHFIAVPHDYPKQSVFTGFWFDNNHSDLPSDLSDFLKAGPPPLLLTFGSMPFRSKFNLIDAVNKLTERFAVRIILVKGWGLQDTALLERNENVKVIDSAPYDVLFPLVKAIVHHGGIGTTAACLRAGKPFMICPILYPIGDQKFWGQISYKKGVAVKPIPITKMTEVMFLNSVQELLANEQLYINSLKLQALINSEDGLLRAIEKIESYN